MDVSASSREYEAFISRLKGAIKRFEDKGLVTQIGFVDELSLRLAESFFAENCFDSFSAVSLRPDSLRRFLVVGTDLEDCSEISFVRARPDRFHSPSHRDYMGALMSLQIDRKLFGDLIVTENCVAYLAVCDKGDILDYLIDNFTECGKARLTVKRVSEEEFRSLEMKYEREVAIVASLRADCLVASIANLSRSQAKSFVERGDFKMFSSPVTNPDFRISEGDVFSLRGYGKYRFAGILGETRRERIRIELLKFGNYIERK